MFSEVNEHFALSQSVLGDKRHIKLVFSLISVLFYMLLILFLLSMLSLLFLFVLLNFLPSLIHEELFHQEYQMFVRSSLFVEYMVIAVMKK